MKVNGDGYFVPQGLDQAIGGRRVTKPRHILERENMSTHFFQFLGQVDVVFQDVLFFSRVGEVPREADGGFTKRRSPLVYRLHGDLQVGQVVE